MTVILSCGTNPPSEGTGPAESGDPKSPPQRGEEPLYAEPRPGVEDLRELTAFFYSDRPELDFRKSYLANEAQLFTALYEGLFSYHPLTMRPVPASISRYELSEDKKTWTFTLRENIRFSNGDNLRAEDFKNAWVSLLEGGQNSPYSSLFDIIAGAREFRLGRGPVEKFAVQAKDDRTLIVTLNSPAPFFPYMLCHHSFSPAHPSMLKKTTWWDQAEKSGGLISNGPYYIEGTGDSNLTLKKNPYYWDSNSVTLEKINYHFSQDHNLATDFWNSGKARWIAGDVDFSRITDRSGIEVFPMFATHYYYIRSSRKPWDDYRVRRAMVLVLPWDKIREDYYLPAKTLIYPLFQGYPEVQGMEKPQVEEAKKLLKEAGYEDGAELGELVLRLTPSPDAARVGGLMAASWMQDLGIKVKIDVVPFADYFDSLKKDDYEVAFSTWIGDFADPYTFLQMWRRDSNLNDAKLNDPDYEKLMEKSMTEEGNDRYKTLAEAEQLLLDRGTVLPINYTSSLNMIELAEVDGWYPNVLDIHPFKYLSFRKQKPLPGVTRSQDPSPSSLIAFLKKIGYSNSDE